MKLKSIFHHFWTAFIEANKGIFFGRWESDFNFMYCFTEEQPLNLVVCSSILCWLIGTSFTEWLIQVLNYRSDFISFICVRIISKIKIRKYDFQSISSENVLNSRTFNEKNTVLVQRKHWQLIYGHYIIYPKECFHLLVSCYKFLPFCWA